jgi:hypothetical protein
MRIVSAGTCYELVANINQKCRHMETLSSVQQLEIVKVSLEPDLVNICLI